MVSLPGTTPLERHLPLLSLEAINCLRLLSHCPWLLSQRKGYTNLSPLHLNGDGQDFVWVLVQTAAAVITSWVQPSSQIQRTQIYSGPPWPPTFITLLFPSSIRGLSLSGWCLFKYPHLWLSTLLTLVFCTLSFCISHHPPHEEPSLMRPESCTDRRVER